MKKCKQCVYKKISKVDYEEYFVNINDIVCKHVLETIYFEYNKCVLIEQPVIEKCHIEIRHKQILDESTI